ncbi:glycosyltransferase [Bacteroides sp. AN502(2024)]|uniref:glycosyltransferase n=1 Tax=Bacteroides sp. AN502(2024) TaxID=3160599 RepID=UPI0035199B56
MHYNASISCQYHRGYESAHRMVLLSRGFRQQFLDYARITDGSKLRFIPNMLSFSAFLSETEIPHKEKIVLVVARLEETQKRISHILRIWQQIEQSSGNKDWTLHIVGHGMDEARYYRLVRQLGLQRVTFHGRQNPEPYYRRASLFMMTSRSEGWGLTLTESQQMGVVPLAYDSYSSLRDIITDGYNGFIIPDTDINTYASRMLELMNNDELRRKIACQAIESAHRFEPATVADKWVKVIEE